MRGGGRAGKERRAGDAVGEGRREAGKGKVSGGRRRLKGRSRDGEDEAATKTTWEKKKQPSLPHSHSPPRTSSFPDAFTRPP